MKKVYLISMMLLFVLDGWSQSTSASQQIDIKFKNGNSVQINANDVDYIDFTEDNPDTPVVPDNPDTPVVPDNPSTPVSPTAGYAVDLGLSVKWASCNVGASSCEEFGERFAWGELSPKSEYTRKTYQYYDTDTNSYVDIGTYIGGTAHDVAQVTWGGGWRMPTWRELDELRRQCTWTWTKVNGVNGYIVKGKNGNSIFFPVEDKLITLWACTLGDGERGGHHGVAELIRFNNSSHKYDNTGEDRWKGNFIRPVCRDDVSGSGRSSNYLTIVAEETGTFDVGGLLYSLDNGLTWNKGRSNIETAQAGKKIMLKAEAAYSTGGAGSIKSSGRFRVEGNVMSLLYGDFFEGKTDLTGMDGVFGKFNSLFSGCTGLTNAEKLLLPATTLADNCYESMFSGCTSLTKVPELPATTLAESCYHYMFSGCTSLTTAPVLPATTLANNCYESMFSGCTSLTKAPELPATILANYCYKNMFQGCSSLTKAHTLPAKTLAYKCYYGMFQDCKSLTTAPQLPATTLANNCYEWMFFGCSSLTTAPELPATRLVESCYDWMFRGCSSLNYIKCLATDISAEDCTYRWVYGVSSTGTFVKASSMSRWSRGENGIPKNWTVQDDTTPGNDSGGNNDDGKGDMSGKYLTFVAIDSGTFKFSGNSVSYSLDNGNTWTTLTSDTNSPTVQSGKKIMWKGNLTPNSSIGVGKFGSTGRFNVEGNAMSLLFGDNFVGRTDLTGFNYAFYYLFQNCTHIVNASGMTLPATTLAECCYGIMFNGCTSLLTAPQLPATTLVDNCYEYMFAFCTSLTTPPELPATTLARYCYTFMFYGCSSLTTAPILPATKMVFGCYENMFKDCTSLTTPPELPATTLADGCYNNMFRDCTSLVAAPPLPATTLIIGCYTQMFKGCNRLNYIKCLATSISDSDYTFEWVDGVSSSGTFVKNSSTSSWTRGVNGIPTNWTVQDDTTPGNDSSGINDNEKRDMSGRYLTFVALEDGYFSFKTNSTDISYSLDGGSTWDTLNGYVYSPLVSAGHKIMWKGNLTAPGRTEGGYFKSIGNFWSSGRFNVEGNIMSLLYSDSFQGKTSLAGISCAFTDLFTGLNVVNAEKLVLPASTLSDHCYTNMFGSCKSLITPPQLPATTLADNCYTFMFSGCTSLVTVPSDLLPVTNLRGGSCCYSSMFSGCTSLTTAPNLPATILEEACYLQMFEKCTALIDAPALPATTLTSQCYDHMFHGCTSLRIAPILPARTLVFWCYSHMFDGCSNLNYIKCLATDISANSCTSRWMSGVGATGTFVKAPSISRWTIGASGIPSGWTVKNE